VSLYLNHTFDKDLTISLIAPDGTEVVLTDANGGGGNDYGTDCGEGNTTFDDAAAGGSITNGTAPFVGTYKPEGLLANFKGKNPNGTWRLHIQDNLKYDIGTLNCWTLNIAQSICTDGGGACPGVPQLCATPSALDFGTIAVGSLGAPQTVFLTSCGTVPLTITNISIVGSNALSFGIASAPCIGAVMATGTVCSVDVVFSPITNAAQNAML